jgi:Protein of unknown function (DUF1566)
MACSSCSQNNHVTSTTNSNQTFCDCACGCNEVVCPVLQPCTEVIDSNCVIYTGENVSCNETTVINKNATLNNTLVNIFNYFCDQFAGIEPIPTITNIGDQIGGGIVVAVFNQGGVAKALIASSINLGPLPWTVPAQQNNLVGATGQSFYDGLTNSNAIVSQTGSAAITYAAGAARLHAGGTFTDWYLPSNWELNMCYDSAAIVNKILGNVNGFVANYYWASTENNLSTAWNYYFVNGTQNAVNKSSNNYVRAVRIHNL